MSTIKPSIAMQRQAVEHLLAGYRADDSIAAAARSAIATLRWVEQYEHLIKEVARLNKEAPFLAEVLREFPGAKIEALK